MVFVGTKILLQPERTHSLSFHQKGMPAFPTEVGLPFEHFTITTKDSLLLRGWYIASDTPPKGTILYLHGIGDNKALGLPLAKLLCENGYNVAMFDLRAHGESEGKYCTYGYYEKYDVQLVLDFLFSKKDFNVGKIGVFGLSMGAAIALQTAAIDQRISVVVAENSFASLRSIFDDYQKRIIKLPFHYLRNAIIARAESIALFEAKSVHPLASVKNISVPILYIVGKQDTKIHPHYSELLYENTNAPKEIFTVENAGHANVREVAGKKYDNTLLSFFERRLR